MSASLLRRDDMVAIMRRCSNDHLTLAIVVQNPAPTREDWRRILHRLSVSPTVIMSGQHHFPPKAICYIASADGETDDSKFFSSFPFARSVFSLDLVTLCRATQVDSPGVCIDTQPHCIAALPYGGAGACSLDDSVKPWWSRLVLSLTCRKLHDFKSSWELCSAVYDAVKGLSELHRQVNASHGDINGSNIVITHEGEGLLVDGELSKETDVQMAARRTWRTGTWSSMSVASLKQPEKALGLSDDLESFYYVLLYHILRYGAASGEIWDLQQSMQDVFDWSRERNDGIFWGGRGKLQFLTVQLPLPAEELAEVLPAPLARLVQELRTFFAVIYWNHRAPSGPALEDIEEARAKLRSPEHFLGLFKTHLDQDGWLHDDSAVDVLSGLPRKNKRRWRM